VQHTFRYCECTACATSSDIFPSYLEISKLKLASFICHVSVKRDLQGLSCHVLVKRDFRVLASSFASNFGKCQCQCKCQCQLCQCQWPWHVTHSLEVYCKTMTMAMSCPVFKCIAQTHTVRVCDTLSWSVLHRQCQRHTVVKCIARQCHRQCRVLSWSVLPRHRHPLHACAPASRSRRRSESD